MADIDIKNAHADNAKPSLLSAVVPVLDDAIDKSHSCEELLQLALVSVLSVAVGSVVSGIFNKKK